MRYIIILILAGLSTSLNGQQLNFALQEKENHWVDSLMSTLSQREKIGQLMVIRVPTPDSEKGLRALIDNLKTIQPGGVTFFAGEALTQLNISNEIQHEAEVPMLVTIDGEWGLAMRLKNTISYPYQMALGAIQDDELIYEMGEEIARQCKLMGIHINFAPVVDVNNNPANPVINYRSFGENKWNVAKKGVAYAKGMEDNGILATLKHFPGHGDTGTDSHYALPVLSHSRERMDSLEMFPFRYGIENNVGGIMIGHLNIPALDDDKDRASSLSRKIVTGEVREKLGFGGILVTDALDMKGVSNHFTGGSAAVESFKAGNDIILLPIDPEAALDAIEAEIRKGGIGRTELNEKVEKILRLKFRLGLSESQVKETEGLLKNLNTPEAKLLNRKLIENSLTVLKNEEAFPVSDLNKSKIATLSVGVEGVTEFQKGLERYTAMDHYQLSPDGGNAAEIRKALDNYDLWIVGLHETQARPYNNKLYEDQVYEILSEITEKKNTIVSLFRNAYTLSFLKNIDHIEGLVVAYYDNEEVEDLASQLIFGGIGAKGKLPVGVLGFEEGFGLETEGGLRFKYTLPEELGLDSEILKSRINAVVQEGLDSAAFPGAEVFLAKDKKVFFHEVYGFHTYDKKRQVEKDDLYDFASVTKVTGPLPALMMLHDQGKFDLDATMADDFPMLKWSNKRDLDWRNVLSHNAQLKSWIPYWTTTFKKNGKFKRKTLSHTFSEDYNYKLSEGLYMHKDYKDIIYKQIKKSPLNEKPGYVYSGLPFYIFPAIIENKTGRSYEEFVKTEIYKKLGAHTLTFNPAEHFEIDRIVPTENDTFFRKMQIHGVVHDEGAAMMKGVSGNAGLFGTANDLAKLMQMYLDMGTYGGDRYISEPTLQEFSTCHYCDEGNKRGLGFDKPFLKDKARGINAPSASLQSFGHSGYTGTFTWVDPENELLYVFFSNRVYPTRLNGKIGSMNLRPRIHQVVYDMLGEQ